MSKSLGNIIPIREAISKYGAETLRASFALSHYRSPIDFDERNLDQAKEIVGKLRSVMTDLRRQLPGASDEVQPADEEFAKRIEGYLKELCMAMDDDFNTPQAMAAYLALANEIENYISAGSRSRKALERSASALNQFASIFGFPFPARADEGLVDRLTSMIARLREEYRSRGDWKISDSIRAELREAGVVLEDTPKGPKWYVAT